MRIELAAEAWSQDAVATAAIEGERIDLTAVRSSVARRLGVGNEEGPPAILVGAYREHAEPMRIVSGSVGREKVHYEAPSSVRVPVEMQRFLDWFNTTSDQDSLVKAALTHVWFETIHPFEGGNGRLGRVLIDLVLARDSGEVSRLIRTSQRLLDKRRDYYAQLGRVQHGGLDVTEWVLWFVEQVRVSCEEASSVMDASLAKATFWMNHQDKALMPRQRKVVNLLLDAGPNGFEEGMSTRKYESVGSTSRATASRELTELEKMGILRRVGAGRSTRYYVNIEGWAPADPHHATRD